MGIVSHRAPVAQLDRANDFESLGREFEPLRARQTKLNRHSVVYVYCKLPSGSVEALGAKTP